MDDLLASIRKIMADGEADRPQQAVRNAPLVMIHGAPLGTPRAIPRDLPRRTRQKAEGDFAELVGRSMMEAIAVAEAPAAVGRSGILRDGSPDAAEAVPAAAVDASAAASAAERRREEARSAGSSREGLSGEPRAGALRAASGAMVRPAAATAGAAIPPAAPTVRLAAVRQRREGDADERAAHGTARPARSEPRGIAPRRDADDATGAAVGQKAGEREPGSAVPAALRPSSTGSPAQGAKGNATAVQGARVADPAAAAAAGASGTGPAAPGAGRPVLRTRPAVAAAPESLPRTVAADRPRTLEQFVCDMMRPLVREWLDANLAAIVEREVRREVAGAASRDRR